MVPIHALFIFFIYLPCKIVIALPILVTGGLFPHRLWWWNIKIGKDMMIMMICDHLFQPAMSQPLHDP